MTAIRETNQTSEVRHFDLNVSVEIKVSPQEAQRQCNIWLGEEVVMGFVAQQRDVPELIVREDNHVVWRCLIRYVAHVGSVGILGYLDVDATTGQIFHTEKQIAQFFELAEQMSKTLPPYKPKVVLPQFRPPAHLEAPITPTLYD